MEKIIEPIVDYDFSKYYLGPPTALTGGNYFTKIINGENHKGVFVQTTKSLTKQGIVKSGKKYYCDLMFSNTDNIFVQWIENLETTCQNWIHQNGQKWFENPLDLCDIENAFTSTLKIYRSGKNYLLRVGVKPVVKLFDETGGILNIDDLTNEMTIISILEFKGVCFSSKSFHIDVEMKQCALVSPDPFLDSCFINVTSKHKTNTNTNTNTDENIRLNIEGTNESSIETDKNLEIDLDSFIEDSVNDVNKHIPNQSSDNYEYYTEQEKEKEQEATDEEEEDEIENESDVKTSQEDEDEYNNLEQTSNFDLAEIDLFSDFSTSLEEDTFVLNKPKQIYKEQFYLELSNLEFKKHELMETILKLKDIKQKHNLTDCEIAFSLEEIIDLL